jgi:hypothetical protein
VLCVEELLLLLLLLLLLTLYELIEHNGLQADVAVGQPGQQLVDLAVTLVNHHVLCKLQHLQ